MHNAALAVTEDLHFDMTRMVEITFEIDVAAPEKRLGFAARQRQGLRELARVAGDFKAAAAAARRRLDENRVADCGRRGLRRGGVADRPGRALHGLHAEPRRRRSGGDLVAHQPDMLGRRADEHEAVLLDRGGEIGVLGEKAETRMDRVGAGDRRRRQDRGDVQIAVARRRRADADASRRRAAHSSPLRRRSNAPRRS